MNYKIYFIFLGLFPLIFSNYFGFTNLLNSALIYLWFIFIPIFFINKYIVQKSIIDLSFWTYVLIFIGYSFFFQNNNAVFPWLDFKVNDSFIFNSIIIYMLGLGAFIYGRHFSNNFNTNFRDLSKTKLNYLFYISLAMISIIIIKLGISTFMLPRVIFAQNAADNGIIVSLFSNLLQVTMPVCLILYLLLFLKKQISKLRLSLATLITLFYFNPIRSSRLDFFLIILILFIYITQFNAKVWVFSLILGFTFLFPLADIFRSFQFNSQSVTDFNSIFTSGDFDGPATLIAAQIYLINNSYLMGANILSAFFSYIPRSIWVGKSYGTGFILTDDLNLSYSNIGVNLWSEFYLAFGIFGVLLFFYIIGKILSWLFKNFQSDYFAFIIYVYSSVSMIFILRGELMQVGLRLVPLVIIAFFITKKTNQSIKLETINIK